MQANSGCAECGTILRPNGELISAPSGGRFIFDPLAGRIWIVCEECGYWSLLGTEVSKGVMPEVERRFNAATDSRVRLDENVTAVRVGHGVDLIKLGPTDSPSTDTIVAARQGDVIHRRYLWVWATLVVALCYLGWKVVFDVLPQPAAFMNLALPTLVLAGFWWSVHEIMKQLSARSWTLAGAAAAVVASVVATLGMIWLVAPEWLSSMPFALAGVLGWTALTRARSIVRVPLDDGSVYKLSTGQIDNMGMSWDAAARSPVAIDTEQRRLFVGDEAARILLAVLAKTTVADRPTIDGAASIGKLGEGLGSIIETLASYQDGPGSVLRLSEVPVTYTVLLESQLAVWRHRKLTATQFGTRLENAQEVARIAEGLDRELKHDAE